jgi:hypothetical protein
MVVYAAEYATGVQLIGGLVKDALLEWVEFLLFIMRSLQRQGRKRRS